MAKKIVVVGSLNMDLVASVPRLPAEGETLTAEAFHQHPGGKGANQAVALGRLRSAVAMLGRVGEDAFGATLRTALEDASVDVSAVRSRKAPSGCALILVTPGGGNAIVVVPGANGELTGANLEAEEDLLRDAALWLCQLEIPRETVEHLGTLAARWGVPLMLDPAPAQALSPALLRRVTWLTPNESESGTLLRHLGEEVASATLRDEDLPWVAGRLLAAGPRNVILKLGERGVFLAGADVAVPTAVSAPAVAVVDTTAAGDAFNAGFAHALVREGKSPIEAARFGCAVAALSVTRAGAQPSLPTREEVEALLGREERR